MVHLRLVGHHGVMVDLRNSAGGNSRVRAFLGERGHSLVARRGELINPLECPAILADEAGRLVGVLSYLILGADCEIVTLHTSRRWTGIGTALIEEMRRLATGQGCTALRVTTTNDNVDALRFYQRRGFVLSELRRRAVDDARRTLKPTIPLAGNHGIPLRDEIELRQELPLAPVGGPPIATN